MQALAGIQGSAEPATTAFLREEHALSNGHRLFLLLLHNVRYLHGCQGKSDTVAADDKEFYLQTRFHHLFGFRFFPCSQMQKEQSLRTWEVHTHNQCM